MYDRFSDRARKVMQLANQEAQRFNHEYIGTEHVLIGLLKEGSGVAANVLAHHNVTLRAIRLEVEKAVTVPPDPGQVILGMLPHMPETKRAIQYAVEEARSLDHNYVGTEHLLLGLLREPEGLAGKILTTLGLNADEARVSVLAMLRDDKPGATGPTRSDTGGMAWEKVALLGRGSLVALPPGTQVKVYQPSQVRLKCGPLEVDAKSDPYLTGTVKIDGVEQDWISELTIHWKAGDVPTVTLTGPVLPPKADEPTVVEPGK
jgi:hypothetical protein